MKTEHIKRDDNTEIFKNKMGASCQNMIRSAEEALAHNPELENVTIMNHSPRYDSTEVDPMGLKPNLATFANAYMLELWLDSPMKNKIFIGSHTLHCSADTRRDRYTDDRSSRYEGVHPYGRSGKIAYTESVINILLSSLQTQAPAGSNVSNGNTQQSPGDADNHSKCPQTNFMSNHNDNSKRKYSSVVNGQPPLKTQNRFSPLYNGSGN